MHNKYFPITHNQYMLITKSDHSIHLYDYFLKIITNFILVKTLTFENLIDLVL